MGNHLNNLIREYNPDVELFGRGDVDLGHNLAEDIFERKELVKVVNLVPNPREETYISYYYEFNKLRLNSEDNFKDSEIRKHLLIKHFHYKGLTGEKNQYKKYKFCTPEKICLASNSAYRTAERIHKKFKN